MLPGGALEQALWLHGAPARRDAVRTAPLPADIEFALRVAGGSPSAVDEAVQATGHDADTVVEAVRFYLQQALFAEGADAYRVLGVERGADFERIRRHHKLLQAWLHPDRNADAWNDVFSTRINQAWTALRNDSARARYDAAPAGPPPAPPASTAHAPSPHAPPPVVMARHWEPVGAPGGRSRARWLALGAFASCLVLLGLILFQEPQPPATVQREPIARVDPAGQGATVVATRAAATEAEVPADVPADVPDDVPELAVAGPGPLPDVLPGAGAPAASGTPTVRAALAQPLVSATAGPMPGADRPPDAPVRAPRRPAPVASPPAATTPVRQVAAADVEPPPSRPSPPAARHSPPAPPVPATAAPVAAASSPASPAVPPATTPAVDPFQRMQEAQASLRSALAYLSDPRGTPPLWNDPRAAENAARTRAALHARGRVRQVDVSGSHWVLREGEASFGGTYATGGRAGERGMMALHLVRREGRWLVSDLRLEPTG